MAAMDNSGHHIYILNLNALSNNGRHTGLSRCESHALDGFHQILWVSNLGLSIHSAEVSLSITLNPHQL